MSIIKNFAWKFSESITSQGVSFIISIVLARLLMPSEFGVVAMIQIFILIAQCFVTSGLSSSLIQKKEADDIDFSSIFWLNILLSIVLYLILFFLAPFVAFFYNQPILTDLLRVYGLILFVYAYNSVQQAWVSRKMKFRLFFYSSLIGSIMSGIVGIFLALKGMGVWALVYQVLFCQLINALVLFFIVEWHPNFEFSKERALPLVKYGWKILSSDLISVLYFQLRQVLIGKFYTASDLAFYNRGNHMPELVSSNIDNSLGQVLFPAMSNHSDSPNEIKIITRKALKVTSYVLFFFMTILIIISEPLVRLLFTDKWLDCVPYFKLICLAKMLQSISNANLQAFKAAGRSDIVLKLELIKKPIGFLLILVSFPISVYAVALTVPVYGLYSAFVNMSSNHKILGYSIKEQLSDLKPSIILSTIIWLVSFSYNLYDVPDVIKILLSITVSSLIYILLSYIYRIDTFFFLYNKIIRLNKNE